MVGRARVANRDGLQVVGKKSLDDWQHHSHRGLHAGGSGGGCGGLERDQPKGARRAAGALRDAHQAGADTRTRDQAERERKAGSAPFAALATQCGNARACVATHCWLHLASVLRRGHDVVQKPCANEAWW